ncbi:DNA cytosine methyltransferase [Phenylobacterium sp. LjRoot225]
MPKLISLYTGVGGLDFGFEAAGFQTAVALERDSACCSTLRLNRNWRVIEGDIHSVSSDEILSVAGLGVGDADVLIGGPPCQPFSKSGYWATGDAKRLADPRADTLTAYLRVLRDAQPKAFLLENVSGLAYRGKDEGLGRILDGVEEINKATGARYRPRWQVLSAAAYGVPQIRERVFIVAARDGTEFKFPAATHGPEARHGKPFRTAWDALGDLPQQRKDPDLRMGGKWAELLPSVPEGENYLWHTNRGGGIPLFGWRTRYWNFLLKLAKDRPSWTIQAQPGSATGPFHWTSRRLAADELCRLQTFPDGLQFDRGRNDVQRMLGNAVPSLLAEVLAREIATQLLRRPRTNSPLKLLPADRGAPPIPERVRTVPKKFHPLVADHADHPGEGKGNGARLRLARAA